MSLPMLAISAFIIGLSGAMMPGPVLTYVVDGSLRKGFAAGPLVITGHMFLELLLVILLLTGMSSLFASELFTAVVGIIGGLMLILMALNMLRSSLKKEISFENSLDKKEGVTGFILPGALLSIANPYWILWWATIGITYLANAYQRGLIGTGAFFVGHISADYAWYSFIAFIVSRGRKLISDSIYRKLVVFFALILLYFAGTFIVDGIQYFGAG